MTDLQLQPTLQVEDLIPGDTRLVFASTMISRKRRLSILVKWFAQNYFLWQELSLSNPAAMQPMSLGAFADELTDALRPYRIRIQRQRVWTWISERNLPRDDNFRVMAEIAIGWQREFALIVLQILASAEPELT